MIKDLVVIAIDFDGVIVEHDIWQGLEHFGKEIDGAKEHLKKLREAGFEIIIHTCRTNPELNSGWSISRMYITLKCFLDSNGYEYDDIWVGNGKPVAHIYLDDRGMHFNGDWPAIYKKITEAFM